MKNTRGSSQRDWSTRNPKKFFVLSMIGMLVIMAAILYIDYKMGNVSTNPLAPFKFWH